MPVTAAAPAAPSPHGRTPGGPRTAAVAVALALGSAPHEERRLNSEPKAEVHGKQVGIIKFIA